MPVLFKQFRGEGGCMAFALGSGDTVCLIDPRFDELDTYENYLSSRGLKVSLVIDTHTHADHYSGTHIVARNFNAPIVMGEATGSARPTLRAKDGQVLEASPDVSLRVLNTPGHTPDSISLVAEAGGARILFAGDTLFIGGSGRTDFAGADPSEQFDSIHGRLGALDGATWIFPGHDYSGLLVSTIEHEKRTNPHMLLTDRAEFVRVKQAEALESGGILQQIVEFNQNAAPPGRPRAGVHAMCATVSADTNLPLKRTSPKDAREVMSIGNEGLFVDIREREECDKARVDGMLNIPMSELFLRWNELRAARRVYFFCQQGNRSQVAMRTARRLGLADATDVEGGLMAWIAAGLPVVK